MENRKTERTKASTDLTMMLQRTHSLVHILILAPVARYRIQNKLTLSPDKIAPLSPIAQLVA
jgi:hypothetical protein